MATKAPKKNSRTSRARTKQAASGSRPTSLKAGKKKTERTSASSARFVKDLVVRGEAAKPDRKGKLPLDATHAITKEDKDGTIVVKRARFKYF